MIEKAFAIEATPEDIWDALWHDLADGNREAYNIEGSQWPRRLQLNVNMSGVRCLLTYSITQRDGFCEVAAALEPLSRRYSIFYIVTFGHIKRNYEMLLVAGLANLKASLEGAEDLEGWEEVVEEN